MPENLKQIVERSEISDSSKLSELLNKEVSGRAAQMETFSVSADGTLTLQKRESGTVIINGSTPTDMGVHSGFYFYDNLAKMMAGGPPATAQYLEFGPTTAIASEITDETTPRNVLIIVDNPGEEVPAGSSRLNKVTRITTLPIRG